MSTLIDFFDCATAKMTPRKLSAGALVRLEIADVKSASSNTLQLDFWIDPASYDRFERAAAAFNAALAESIAQAAE